MAAVCAQPAPPLTERSSSPQPALSLNTSLRGSPAAVPNKHLPICSPGPRPRNNRLPTPPASPLSTPSIEESPSLLHPPQSYPKITGRPSIYGLSGSQLKSALDQVASHPLPDPKLVFPWLHGLHPENNLQLAFFIARRRSLRRVPRCLRSITIVKAGGDLSHSKIKGAIAPEELLHPPKSGGEAPQFLDVDPREGFSVRNFQIQAAKLATLSDIVVYRDDKTSKEEVFRLAERIAKAQKAWADRDRERGLDRPLFGTYVLQERFCDLSRQCPEIVALRSDGSMTGHVLDFFHSERLEMHAMSSASEIAHNVWLGPTPDVGLQEVGSGTESDPLSYELLIEATDMAQVPDRNAYSVLESLLAKKGRPRTTIPQLEFPGSGSIMPPTWSQNEVDGLMYACEWIYRQANDTSGESQALAAAEEPVRKRKDSKVQSSPERDDDGDSTMTSPEDLNNASPLLQAGRKILLHCADGYTETTLLAVAYYMYANCVPLHQAYIELHNKYKRNFFAYPTDIALLTTIQPRVLQASPAAGKFSITDLAAPSPEWTSKMDGSLPSRIMPYMYLGNLGHANNPGLLKELNIGQVLSVGEPISWTEEERKVFDQIGAEHGILRTDRVMYIEKVQDNGVDPLTEEFPRCLDFIEKGRKAGTATLVHCRVGVSRSATICIAEVMNELGVSFPKAYCFVRARRLNVIIQPHLRFSYELLKWEEHQAKKRNVAFKRELEWATIAREIAAMNRPYSRQ